MHYWYDERSAGGLKQKEERSLSLFLPRLRGAVTSTFYIHQDSICICARVHYVSTIVLALCFPANSFERALSQAGKSAHAER